MLPWFKQKKMGGRWETITKHNDDSKNTPCIINHKLQLSQLLAYNWHVCTPFQQVERARLLLLVRYTSHSKHARKQASRKRPNFIFTMRSCTSAQTQARQALKYNYLRCTKCFENLHKGEITPRSCFFHQDYWQQLIFQSRSERYEQSTWESWKKQTTCM